MGRLPKKRSGTWYLINLSVPLLPLSSPRIKPSELAEAGTGHILLAVKLTEVHTFTTGSTQGDIKMPPTFPSYMNVGFIHFSDVFPYFVL